MTTHTRTLLRSLATGTLSAAFASLASATVIFSEAFNVGERLTTNLPATSAWYTAGGTASDATAGQLDLALAGGAAGLVFTHFTAAGSPATIAVGEYIQANFSLSVSNAANSSNGMRVAFVDTLGTRRLLDGSTSNADFSNDRGYGFFFNPNGTGHSVRARIADNNNLVGTASAWNTASGGAANSTTGINLTSSTYNFSLRVTRTADDAVTTLGTISGGDLLNPIFVTDSFIDGVNDFTSFDMFAIGWVSGATSGAGTFTISGVSISVVPEPSQAALALSALALGMVALRRRKA